MFRLVFFLGIVNFSLITGCDKKPNPIRFEDITTNHEARNQIYSRIDTSSCVLLPVFEGLPSVNKLLIDQRDIFILGGNEYKRVYHLEQNSQEVEIIDHIGTKVQEYLNIDDFIIIPEERQLIVLDSDSKKLVWYNYDGIYVKHEFLNFNAVCFIKSNDYYYFYTAKMPSQDVKNCEIIVTDTNFTILSCLLPYKEKDPIRFLCGNVFFKLTSDKVLFFRSLDSNGYELYGEHVSPFFTLAIESNPLGQNITNKNFSKSFKKATFSYGNPICVSDDIIFVRILEKGKIKNLLLDLESHNGFTYTNIELPSGLKIDVPIGYSDGYMFCNGILEMSNFEGTKKAMDSVIEHDNWSRYRRIIRMKINE